MEENEKGVGKMSAESFTSTFNPQFLLLLFSLGSGRNSPFPGWFLRKRWNEARGGGFQFTEEESRK